MLICASCSEDAIFSFVLGPQTNFIEGHEYKDMFNVFGVLRPDSVKGQPMSFVLVEKTVPAVTPTPDSFHVYDARVMVYAMEGNLAIDSFEFKLDTVRSYQSTYRSDDFEPMPGREYRLECSKEGFPTVTSTAVVPFPPQIWMIMW